MGTRKRNTYFTQIHVHIQNGDSEEKYLFYTNTYPEWGLGREIPILQKYISRMGTLKRNTNFTQIHIQNGDSKEKYLFYTNTCTYPEWGLGREIPILHKYISRMGTRKINTYFTQIHIQNGDSEEKYLFYKNTYPEWGLLFNPIALRRPKLYRILAFLSATGLNMNLLL